MTLRAAASLARMWVALYTSGIPAPQRADRRAEIDADLWEQQQDAAAHGEAPVLIAGHILLRTVTGMADDLAWRIEAVSSPECFDVRRLMMSVSPRQMRWLGLCALVGGTLQAGGPLAFSALGNPGRVYTSETSWHLEGPMAIIGPLLGALMMLLFIGGTAGLYVANRRETGKAARAGFFLLAAGFGSTLIGMLLSVGVTTWSGAIDILFNLLIVPPFVVMIPLGFLLLGIGLPRPVRRLPLLLGVFLTIKSMLGLIALALREWWPAAPALYRSDSPLGTATEVLMGIAVAAIGYSLWSAGRGRSPAEPPSALTAGSPQLG